VPVTDTVVHTAADTVMSTRSQAVDIQPSAQNRLRHLAVTAIRVGAHSQSHTVVVRTTAFDEYLSQPSAHIAVDTVSSTRTLRRTVLAVGAVFSTQPMTNSHGHTAFDVWNTLGRSPEPVLFILIITRIPGRPILTGTEEPSLRLKRVRGQSCTRGHVLHAREPYHVDPLFPSGNRVITSVHSSLNSTNVHIALRSQLHLSYDSCSVKIRHTAVRVDTLSVTAVHTQRSTQSC
jgi:hypothetical protein